MYTQPSSVFSLSANKNFPVLEEVQDLSNVDTISLNKKILGAAKGRVDYSRNLFGILPSGDVYSNGFALARIDAIHSQFIRQQGNRESQ